LEAFLDDTKQGLLPGAFRLGYPPPRGHWDEMVAGDGWLRPHWDVLARHLLSLPVDEMDRRWQRGLRLIRENGVTYNVYGDPRGADRPWQLDPIPMILPAEEWRGIESALIQRATLLDRILADVYGPQQLLAEGLLPPMVVFAHPGYLRALRHILVPGGIRLHLYAADLARSPNGQWWVVSDRCEAPSGAGYALENRITIARTLTEMLRAQPVEPLTPFLYKLRDTLFSLSPRRHEAPRTVLLTPGHHNESYFEHAYLARQLGYTLVEAEDLTVRDGRAFLKTLDGLQPVDVILRRTDGAYCDPLELRHESTLGIAGLVQAVRRGTVVVANSLGSGIVESGALAPFLPILAQRLLGEDLKLPSVATWWCGGDVEREYVLANLDQLVVKTASPGPGSMQPVFGDGLSPDRRSELTAAIRCRPGRFLAQEWVKLSTVPVWSGGTVEPRRLMLRVFLAAHDGSYVAMPGGLTRVAAEREGSVVSMQQGGGSKDTWVLAADGDRRPSVMRSVDLPAKLVRGAHDLPSRTAENLYWFGRNVERTEGTTRLLRAALSRAGSGASLGAAEKLPVALGLLSRLCRLSEDSGIEERTAAVADASFDPEHAHGLRASVERMHRTAGLVRDRLSLDTWRAVNRLYQEVVQAAQGNTLNMEDLVNQLNSVVLACEALSGLSMENMTRGLGWRFVDVGRRLERGIYVLDTLSGVVLQKGGTDSSSLEILLEVSDSAMTYRSRYLSMPQFAPVLDLLLADGSNPRSLAFQLEAMDAHMAQLAASRRSAFTTPEQRLTIWLTGAVRTADVEVLAKPDEDGGRRSLATFLEVLRSKLWELSETLTREYFTHAVSRSSAAGRITREPLL
jgi:uncharacterized circularly permuted ATP-grasp superfamily protein/uncharacterized alpha-E superfamily protein